MIVFGVPVIRRYDLLWRLLASLKNSSLKPDRVIVIDNGGKLGEHFIELPDNAEVIAKDNVGCSGAWNLILDACVPNDHVLISNDDILLGPGSVSTIVNQMSESDFVLGHGFSLFGLKRSLADKIGFFDENFFPAYFEDNDYTRRMKLTGSKVGVVDSGSVHGGSLPGGSASLLCRTEEEQKEFGQKFEKLRTYYGQKWGGRPGQERFSEPFKGKPPSGWRLRPVTG